MTSAIQTYTGKFFNPFEPEQKDITIEDIAHSLAHICRYNGHCQFFYSVAEHSIIMSYQVPSEAALYALLHDAGEAYLGDIVRPLKTGEHSLAEEAVFRVICERFGFSIPDHVRVKVENADLRMLATEKKALMRPGRHWPQIDQVTPYSTDLIIGLPPQYARAAFLERFRELEGQRNMTGRKPEKGGEDQ